MSPTNLGKNSRFLGGLLLAHGSAQTHLLERAITPV